MQKFNGQLINQFPNNITGNAAAGAQVTIRVKSSGTLATLYATNSVGGGTLPNPLTTDAKGYYGFYAADGVYTLDVNISGTPQLEIQLQDVADLQAQFNGAVSNAGYIPVGTFAAGCAVSQANGVVSDGSSYWRWDGALPKTVTAGSEPLPVGVGGWFLVGGDGLRGDLAATDSTVPIAGVPASLAVGKAVTLRPVVGESNAMPRIIAALNAYDVVYVVGDLPITTTNPTALVNKKLIGFRGVSSLTYAAGLTGTVWTLGAESSIEGISHIGPVAAPDVTDGTTYAASADEALALKGIGSLSCIKVQQQSSKVQNCEFTGFSKWAIETSINNVSPNSNAVDTNISDNRIVYNYGGIDIPAESEYMKFLNNSICWNVVGVNKAGGNNTFTGNNIDHNRINFITKGGANNSHGGITGGTMNHGKLAAIIAKDITVGEAVSGVNFFDSGNLGIWIENSVGVNIVGNLLGRTNVYCVGRSTTEAGKPGVNTISNNLTNLAGVTYQFRRNWNKATGQSDPATPDNCIFRNNYHMEGQASRDGSNWDEYALNDTDTIDSDGFKAETTIAGVTASRYVTGQPIGGAKFLGAGNVTGAIKIVLPVSSFNNSLCTFRISLSTSNGRGASFEFDAYALTGGTWSTLQLKSANGYFYKVRFGRTASGQPVLYIGELATVFTNTFVNIERFTMHQGAWAQSRYWKRGWVISSEPSAFENVTLETPDAGGGSSRIDFSGDLNTIATDSKVYAVSAANTPTGLNGFCTTIPRLTNSGVRSQFFHQTDNKIYVRFTATGDAGYSAWIEK